MDKELTQIPQEFIDAVKAAYDAYAAKVSDLTNTFVLQVTPLVGAVTVLVAQYMKDVRAATDELEQAIQQAWDDYGTDRPTA